MTHVVALAVLFAAAPVPKAADPETMDVTGTYACAGTDISGAKYEATVEIAKDGDAYKVSWVYKDGTSFVGVGVRAGKVLSVGWAGNAGGGKVMVGVMVYEVKKDGTLEGRWTMIGAKGKVSTETLSPTA